MSRIAILVPELAGHLLPAGNLGGELQRRGHEVTVVARGNAASLVHQLDLPLRELSDEGLPNQRVSRLRWFFAQLLRKGWIVRIEKGLCWKAEQVLRQAPDILRELRTECVLVDQDVLAGGTVAERLKLPYVTLSSALLWNEEPGMPPHYMGWLPRRGIIGKLRNHIGYAAWQTHLRPPLEVINRYRRSWQLPPLRRFGDTLSSYAQLSQMCVELDFLRHRLSPCCHYIGSLAATRPNTVDFPWQKLDGRPLIYVSLGTMPGSENISAYRKIAVACAGIEAQLVLGLGKWRPQSGTVADELGQLPGDPILVGFAPQLALLDRASLLIGHAGLNSVLEALIHGVPMLLLPRFADQPGMAARVVHAGAGLRASYTKFTAEQLRPMVQRLLGDNKFRQRATALGRALMAAGGAIRAADIVEQVLETGLPVTRDAFSTMTAPEGSEFVIAAK